MENLKLRLAHLLRKTERYTKTDSVYLASGAFWSNLNFGVYTLLGFVMTVIFTHLLSKETYGMYQYILSIAGLVSTTTLTGMNTAITQAVAKGYEGEFRRATRYQLLLGVIPAVCGFGISLWYFIQGNPPLATSVLWIALFLPLSNAFNTWAAYTGGKKLFRVGTYYGFLNSLISYTGLILFVYFVRDFVWIAFANFFFGFLGNFIVYTLVTRNIPPNNEKDSKTLSYGKHLSLMAIPGMIAAQIDTFIVFHFIGPTNLAIYSLATLLPEKVAGALKFISNIALPKFSAMKEHDVKISVWKNLGKIFILASGMATAYALTAPYIFRLFFPTYTESVLFTQVYALSLFSIVSTFLQTALTSQQKTKELYTLNSTIPFTKIVLLIILMFYFGIWGVIWAQIITVFVSIVLLLYLLKKPHSATICTK